MSCRHLFFPETVKFADTPFNRNISVRRFFRQPTLYVDGLVESGDILTHIWKVGITKLIPKHFIPQSILILGLGGGSNAYWASRHYPLAQITAVEIDPLMEKIGRQYFDLHKIKKLKVIIDDAINFAKKMTPDTQYDLILVDCFVGKYIPKKMENLDFLNRLKNHSRYTLINRIRWFEHHGATMRFMKSLSTRFVFITTSTISNLVISLV